MCGGYDNNNCMILQEGLARFLCKTIEGLYLICNLHENGPFLKFDLFVFVNNEVTIN